MNNLEGKGERERERERERGLPKYFMQHTERKW